MIAFWFYSKHGYYECVFFPSMARNAVEFIRIDSEERLRQGLHDWLQ